MDHAVLLERRPEAGQRLDRCSAPQPFVHGELGAVHLDRHGVVVEDARVDRRGGFRVRLGGELVEAGAGETPAFGDEFGSDALAELESVVAGDRGGTVGLSRGPVRAERYPAHGLDATRDDEVVLSRHHGMRGLVDRLLAGAAGPVDRDRRDVFGPAGGEHGEPADVAGLVADLGDTAPDHVVDRAGVDAGALDERLQHLGRQIRRVDRGEGAVALADRGAYGVDDDGVSHANS